MAEDKDLKRKRYAEDPEYREDTKARSRLARQRKKAELELPFGPPVPKRKLASVSERNLWRKYRAVAMMSQTRPLSTVRPSKTCERST